MLVYYFVPFIASNLYLIFWVSNGHNSVTVQNRTNVYMNFFHHKDLGNHLLQLRPKVVKHPVYSVTFSRKSCRLWDNVEKYFRAGQATDDITAQALFMLNNWGYRHTLRICNIAFSTATMVTLTTINLKFIRTLPLLRHSWEQRHFTVRFCADILWTLLSKSSYKGFWWQMNTRWIMMALGNNNVRY